MTPGKKFGDIEEVIAAVEIYYEGNMFFTMKSWKIAIVPVLTLIVYVIIIM